MIIGTPAVKWEVDQTDQIGLRTIVASLMWQPPTAVRSREELDALVPAPPAVLAGMGEYIGRETRQMQGHFRTYWSFQGVDGDGKSVTFKTRGKSLDYGFQGGFAQVDIALLPRIAKLIEQFRGRVIDGEILFDPTITASEGSALSVSSSKPKPNPMFGQKDFLRVEGTYYYRYMALSLAGLGAHQNKIVSAASIPGEAPSFSGRDWMGAPINYQRRGPVYEVVETYWLSGEGGWPKVVYGSLSSGAYGAGGGLTTGGLEAASGL